MTWNYMTDAHGSSLAVQAEQGGIDWEIRTRGDDSLTIDEMFEHWYSHRWAGYKFCGYKEIQSQAFISGFSAARFPERYSMEKRCFVCGSRVDNVTKVLTCQTCRSNTRKRRTEGKGVA